MSPVFFGGLFPICSRFVPSFSDCCVATDSTDSQGETGKAEDVKTAGRRNYPEAVPKETSVGKDKVNRQDGQLRCSQLD